MSLITSKLFIGQLWVHKVCQIDWEAAPKSYNPLSTINIRFIWQTQILDTKTTMNKKYPKDQYSCPHCLEGRRQGVLETPAHILSSCSAYRDLRVGLNPEEILEDHAAFLRLAITKRITLEDKLKITK